MLSTIDLARAKGLKGDQLTKLIRKARDDFVPLTPAGTVKDVYSHFILRIAYCRSADLQRWFLQNEVRTQTPHSLSTKPPLKNPRPVAKTPTAARSAPRSPSLGRALQVAFREQPAEGPQRLAA